MSFVGLCDCNNFFASCERVFRPDLNGKPVVVLSNNDGCVVARSNEAKGLGIKMGTPIYQIMELVDRKQVHVFSSNYQLYGDMSHRVMSILRSELPAIEVYSIDEAFLDMSPVPLEKMKEFAENLSAKIFRYTGIPVSIGIAPTKTLAKVASKLCKKYPKLNGGCLMYKPADVEKVLRKTPVEDIWGIGRRYSKTLKRHLINTAWDFCNLTESSVRAQMGVNGVRTWRELHGEKCIGFEEAEQKRQTLCISRSFAKEFYTLDDVNAAISTFAAKAAEKLRDKGLRASQMDVFLMTNRFREDQPQSFDLRSVCFDPPIDDTLELSDAAHKALKCIFKKGYGYKKGGVMLSGLIPSNAVQGSLFDTVDHDKSKSLMKAIDTINHISGLNTVCLASQGKMDDFSTRKLVSRRYTTVWEEMMEVKV